MTTTENLHRNCYDEPCPDCAPHMTTCLEHPCAECRANEEEMRESNGYNDYLREAEEMNAEHLRSQRGD